MRAMPSSLKLLFVAAECAPLAKVGGLGDVVGALPAALRALGHDARVALPYHRVIDQAKYQPRYIADFEVPTRDGALSATVHETEYGGVPIYLVGGPLFLGRTRIYGEMWADWTDYAFFSMAALGLPQALDWRPDVVHAHDWHAAATAGWMGTHGRDHPFYAPAASVYTFHNLPYTGEGGGDALYRFGLGASPAMWLPESLRWSPMALGLSYGDMVSTVSPGYAGESLTPKHGRGLEGLLWARLDRFAGILNGIDCAVWDPATDQNLEANYDADSLERRIENKRALQRDSRLLVRDEVPVLGAVFRLDPQKGVSLLLQILPVLLSERDVQVVILGSGQQAYEDALAGLAYRFPDRVTARLEFNAAAAARIYAGADIFLMPSLYEPCGLGQMIALRYGAVPLVRATGGLKDTVQNYDEPGEAGTGFVFNDFTASALLGAIRWALSLYPDRRRWRNLQLRGMAQDFSWEKSARAYQSLYQQAIAFRRAA